MARPGRKPENPRKPGSKSEIVVAREEQTQRHLQGRAERLNRLVQGMAGPQAMFLLQGNNLGPFVQEHNIKPHEIPGLKSMLQRKAGQV